MPVTIPDPRRPGPARPLLRRLGWFAALYVLGVAVVGTIAFVLRLWIKT